MYIPKGQTAHNKIKLAVILIVVYAALVSAGCFDDDNPSSPVIGNAPEAEILNPADGATFFFGDTLTLIGSGTDPEDGNLADSCLTWIIDRRFTLGHGDTLRIHGISQGGHTLRLTVEDSDGNRRSKQIDIYIMELLLTLDNSWPNNDGTYWKYDYSYRSWDYDPSSIPLYSTEAEVPDIPSMTELEYLLHNQPTGNIIETSEAVFMLEFAGDTTTGSGVTAQNLRESLFVGQVHLSSHSATQLTGGFLSRLSSARPDLAGRIRTEDNDKSIAEILSQQIESISLNPVLVHGRAWEKTSEYIGTYGDLDQLLAWKFLESNLEVSHEFTFQLATSLADDIFLHCKILRTLTAETAIGSFKNSIECLYAVDYGIYYMPGGYRRPFDYGTVIYSPGVGPVYSYERIFLFAGDPVTLGIGDLELKLIESNLF
jgi:hypothetical protein